MTHSNLRYLFFLPLFVLVSCADRGQTPGKGFEGKIVQKITINKSLIGQKQERDSTDLTGAGAAHEAVNPSGPSVEITMFAKGDKVAYDMSLIGFPIKIHTIIDRNARTVALLTPDKMAYVSDLHTFDKVKSVVDDSINRHHDMIDSLQAHMPQSTGQKKTINGLACEEFTTKIGDNDLTFWLTQDSRLHFYDIVRDAFLGKQRTGMGGMEEALAIVAPFLGEGRTPVVATLSHNGQTLIKSEMVSMSEESVSDDILTIPSDYKVVRQDEQKKPLPTGSEK